ncbi:E3 ubiquitin ligase PQT3-like, partial [Bienertia sinuspersici]
MAVYYKFKSAKDYHSIPIDGPFISIIDLKERIYNSKLGKGKDFDLVISNAQTNEEYLDEAMLIPRNISVLIRRVPGPPCKTIVTQPNKPEVENHVECNQPVKSNFKATDSSDILDFEASEWDDEFGSIYATTSDITLGRPNNLVPDPVPTSKTDEDEKIKALVENSSLWPKNHYSFGPGRRSGWGGRGQGGFECKTPPQGYVCRRCKVAGHFIQHCPTNGDPNYDIKRARPPTGIPKSTLVQPDGNYALPSGTAAVLQPNEAVFEKEMSVIPSSRALGELPPELHCPLCKEVIKDAVITSKCCFQSIRDNIISKSMCICGARDILADHLVPNMTLRDTINRILESGYSGSSSANKSGSGLRMLHLHAVLNLGLITHSTCCIKGDQMAPSVAKETSKIKENVDGIKHCDAPKQQLQTSEEGKITKAPDVSEAAHEPKSCSACSGRAQRKVAVVEAAADMGWMGMQPCMDGYMDPSAFNPFWPSMQQPSVNEFMSPFGGNMRTTRIFLEHKSSCGVQCFLRHKESEARKSSSKKKARDREDVLR